MGRVAGWGRGMEQQGARRRPAGIHTHRCRRSVSNVTELQGLRVKGLGGVGGGVGGGDGEAGGGAPSACRNTHCTAAAADVHLRFFEYANSVCIPGS